MKRRITLNMLLILALFGLLACETEQTETVRDIENFDESARLSTAVAKMKPAKAETDHCGVTQDYELRVPGDLGTGWGTVTVYNDGEKLYIQYDLIKDWGLQALWIFIGPEFPFVDDPGNGWHNNSIDGLIVINPVPGDLPNSYLYEHPFEEFMEEGCFVIALKARIQKIGVDPQSPGNEQIPRVYLNLGDGVDYIWNYPYCICEGPGTGTQGYWKNHDWPVDGLTIGGVYYSEDWAKDLMKHPTAGDKTYNMFEQLVAAMLNVEMKNTSYCINETIALADAWMGMYWPSPDGPDDDLAEVVPADSQGWKDGEPLHEMLDDYNNGLLCADKRD